MIQQIASEGARRALQKAIEAMLHEIWMSATREEAIKAFDRFIETYSAK